MIGYDADGNDASISGKPVDHYESGGRESVLKGTRPRVPSEVDWSNIEGVDASTQKIQFGLIGGGHIAMTFQQALTTGSSGSQTIREAHGIRTAIRRAEEQYSTTAFAAFKKVPPPPRPKTIEIGEEHDTFGELLLVDGAADSAVFGGKGDVSETALSALMVQEIVLALLAAGATTADRLHDYVEGAVVSLHLPESKWRKLMEEAVHNRENPTPVPTTGDDGLGLIINAVQKSPDPFIAAGEFLMKVTNALTEIARGTDDG